MWLEPFSALRFRPIFSVGLSLMICTATNCLLGQSDPSHPPKVAGNQAALSSETNAQIETASSRAVEEIQRLAHPSYRTRQAARNHLEENPYESLPAIEQMIQRADVVSGVQLVEILSGLAAHSDLTVSHQATQILAAAANKATNVGLAAANSLSAIRDLQEERANEVLVGLGAYIGPQNFSLNGRVSNVEGPWSLRIDEQFDGTDQDFEWIRYLKSVRVVYFRGSNISPRAIEAICQLKDLQAVKLRSVTLTKDQLLLFQDLHSLEHLGLSYMDVDDSFVPNLMQLSIGHSIRLYGTKVSEAGAEQLVKQFDGLEIFRGSGGFLGISSVSRVAQVEQVTPGSAASRAGIRQGDTITAINDTPIQTFEELRKELGKYEADETVYVRLTRYHYDDLKNTPVATELTVKATLQEESN